jgi:hypothetical protein
MVPNLESKLKRSRSYKEIIMYAFFAEEPQLEELLSESGDVLDAEELWLEAHGN